MMGPPIRIRFGRNIDARGLCFVFQPESHNNVAVRTVFFPPYSRKRNTGKHMSVVKRNLRLLNLDSYLRNKILDTFFEFFIIGSLSMQLYKRSAQKSKPYINFKPRRQRRRGPVVFLPSSRGKAPFIRVTRSLCR